MKSTETRTDERTAVGSGQGESPCGAGDSDTDTAKVTVHKLSAECPSHGTVPVVCPRCAGQAGGKAHRGTLSRHKTNLKALADARRVMDASPVMQALAQQAEEEKRFQALCDKLGMTAEERAGMGEDMIRMSLFRELADRAGWTQEERLQVLSLVDRKFSINGMIVVKP